MAAVTHAESASYAQSGFSNRMGWGARPALLLIDVCTAYWTTGSPLDISANPAGAASPDSMRRLLKATRDARVPVIWSTVRYSKGPDGMKEAGLFYNKAKMLSLWQEGDTRGWDQWMEGLQPKEGELIIVKKFASVFFETNLRQELNDRGIDTLVLCGVSTSGCVRATTLDSMQSGFRPMVCAA